MQSDDFVLSLRLTKLFIKIDGMGETATDTEKLILEAAVKEFSLKGFDGARTASIAKEAGVTHAMFHYYFRTKEKLFQRIFQEKMKDIMNMMTTEITSAEGDIKERLKKGIERHFDFLKANDTLPVFLVTTLNSRPELYHDLKEDLLNSFPERFSRIQREFDRAAERGEIVRVDAARLLGDVAALNVFPFVATSLFMAVTGYGEEQREEFLEARKKENVETILKRIS